MDYFNDVHTALKVSDALRSNMQGQKALGFHKKLS